MITNPPISIEEINKENFHYKEIKFGKNFHPEFKGFIFEKNDSVWISVIEAKEIGKGHFSKLIAEFKQKYNSINIPTPSKMITERSIHLGFNIKREFFGEPFNEWGIILFWERKVGVKGK